MGGLYWDACVLIYRLQQVEPWNRRIASALAAIPEPKLMVTELGRMECRVKPLRDGDQATLAKYDKFFAAPSSRLGAVQPGPSSTWPRICAPATP